MVYNRLDRLVLTQDGNQRLLNHWTYYKYDALDREILQGTYTNSATRSSLQSTLSSSSLPMWEERNNSSSTGYTNNAFPTSSIVNTLIAQFYDNYDVLGLASSYAPVGAVTAKPKGLETVSRITDSDGSNLLLLFTLWFIMLVGLIFLYFQIKQKPIKFFTIALIGVFLYIIDNIIIANFPVSDTVIHQNALIIYFAVIGLSILIKSLTLTWILLYGEGIKL